MRKLDIPQGLIEIFRTKDDPPKMPEQPIVVKVQPWSWDDEDGCSDYGMNVWIDNVLVTEYGQDTANLLQSVVSHLTGKEVRVYGYKEDDPLADDDDWEWRL